MLIKEDWIVNLLPRVYFSEKKSDNFVANLQLNGFDSPDEIDKLLK